MFWLIATLVIAVAAWYFLKRRDSGIPAQATTKPPPKSVWGKLLVIPPGTTACQAAKAIEGQAFPRDELPVLPLVECTNRFNCKCRLDPLTEKRAKERRSGTERRPNLRYDPENPQRRSGHDRREKNNTPFNDGQI